MRVLFALAAAAFLFSMAAAGIAIHQGAAQRAHDNAVACRAENVSRDTLRNLLTFFEGRTLSNKDLTTAQKNQITAFYKDARASIPTVAC